MTHVNWMIKGSKIGACSCDYGCPCEFNARPTNGACEGLEAHRIDEGYFGDVRLDGLVVAAWYHWPGAVHEGSGTVQGIIDRRADADQTEALFKILGGEEQEPTTVFKIYGSTIETEHDPVFADIGFDCDVEARTGRIFVDGLLDLKIEPIRNPVTGQPHRARIVLPEGFEFRDAEMGSGKFKVNAALKYAHENCYAALFDVAYGPYGVIEGGT
ncbi:MAG: DUF1326 domain-containing protein [Paracoccaceae bacterium]